MQKRVIKMSRACLFFTLLCLSFQAQAATFVDLNEVTFSENKQQRKALRLVLFDIEGQEYSHIGYYNLDGASPPLDSSPAPKRPLPLDPKFDGIKVFYDGTDGTIEVAEEHKARYITRVRGLIPSTITFTPRTSEAIRGILSSFNSGTQTPLFNAKTYALKGDKEKRFMVEDEREFTKLSPDKDANSIERGVLGELATEMTMTSFGCTRHLSQNASNHGLDGVYVTPDQHLFLTESKCWHDLISAEAFMGKDLNEGRIYGKLQAIEEPHLNTKTLIEKYIAAVPQSIFKIVHRIKPNGKSQYCIQPFDLFLYKVAQPQSALISVDSSTLHKKLIFGALRGRLDLGKCIDIDFVEFIEGISGLSREEIGMALIMHSLAPDKRQNVMRYGPYIPPISDNGEEKKGKVVVTPSPIASSPSPAGEMSPPSTSPELVGTDLSSTFDKMSVKDKESKSSPATSPGQPSDPLPDLRKREAVVFASYTLPKLRTLIRLINNNNGTLAHTRIGRETLADFCETHSGEKPLLPSIRALIEKESIIAPGKAKPIWDALTEKFEELYSTGKIGLKSRQQIVATLESIK